MSDALVFRTALLRFSSTCLAIAGLLLAPAARASQGVLLAPSQLPAQELSELGSQIAQARHDHPRAFRAVHAVRERIAELDGTRRGRYVPVGPMLKGLGPDALLPMLELLALDAEPQGALSASAWLALRAGLVEAVGSLRDPRARAVLTAILDASDGEFLVVRTAAEALGKLADDAAVEKLVSLANASAEKRAAALAGMGECRRTTIALALSKAISEKPDEARAKAIVTSLGRVGNAWAWRTPAVRVHANEERETRQTAARALMFAFTRYTGSLRQAASNALLVVNDPSTPALVKSARANASPELLRALEVFARRFDENPIR